MRNDPLARYQKPLTTVSSGTRHQTLLYLECIVAALWLLSAIVRSWPNKPRHPRFVALGTHIEPLS